MKATRRLVGALAVVAALGGGLTACDSDTNTAGGTTGGAGASAKPADGAKGDGPKGEPGSDCGTPPQLPAGHKMVEIDVPPSKGSMSAKDAKPTCTPNDWIYHGQGEPKYYIFAPGSKAEIALGSGKTKDVPAGELWMHAGDCLTDQSAVKPPYSCSGNIYDITTDSEGKVTSIKEIWHP